MDVDGDYLPQAEPPLVEFNEQILYMDGSVSHSAVLEVDSSPTQVMDDASGSAAIESSRAYQLEMLDQSLQRNVIVSVSEQPPHLVSIILLAVFKN